MDVPKPLFKRAACVLTCAGRTNALEIQHHIETVDYTSVLHLLDEFSWLLHVTNVHVRKEAQCYASYLVTRASLSQYRVREHSGWEVEGTSWHLEVSVSDTASSAQ